MAQVTLSDQGMIRAQQGQGGMHNDISKSLGSPPIQAK